MKILCACEESQEVTFAFRCKGHEAYSCDLVPCSGGFPEWHIQDDALEVMKSHWDMIIAFPPCTYITKASAVRMRVNGELQLDRYYKAMEAREFFMQFYNNTCNKIAIENPIPLRIVNLPGYSQIIQPYWFGHPYSKSTCLWLKNLPCLFPTKLISEHVPYVNGGCKDKYGNYRRFPGRKERNQRIRSKTFPGVAAAMADQWG